jgi:hypothetical protein
MLDPTETGVPVKKPTNCVKQKNMHTTYTGQIVEVGFNPAKYLYIK